jgi:hypothetical protein
MQLFQNTHMKNKFAIFLPSIPAFGQVFVQSENFFISLQLSMCLHLWFGHIEPLLQLLCSVVIIHVAICGLPGKVDEE